MSSIDGKRISLRNVAGAAVVTLGLALASCADGSGTIAKVPGTGPTDATTGSDDGSATADRPTSTTADTTEKTPAAAYATLAELHAAILGSGATCGALVDDDAPTGNPYEIDVDTPGQQGRCPTGPGTALVFSIIDDPDELEARADQVFSTMASISSRSRPSFVLVGPNWLINLSNNAEAAERVHAALGGELRVTEGD